MSRIELAALLLWIAWAAPLAVEARQAPPQMHGVAQVRSIDAEHGTIDLQMTGGQARRVRVAPDVRVLGIDGQPLAGGLASPQLKAGTIVQVTAIPPAAGGGGPTVIELRIAPESGARDVSGRSAGPPGPLVSPDTSKLIALPELGTNEYSGERGGLYPDGRNQRPAGHEHAGVALAHEVQPVDGEGKRDPNGKIVLLSIGMSNTVQAFNGFIAAARGDTRVNPRVVLVNGAHGGITAHAMHDANDGATGTTYWNYVDEQLRAAGATRAQVQAIWIKQADANPREDFPTYTNTLASEIGDILRIARSRFSNLKLAYLSSRTYGGFARSPLNPEPYAYWSGFAVKKVIAAQLSGDPALNFDSGKGPIRAPWLSWGPYLWSKGFTETDFAADGTHESRAGQTKVGRMLLDFFSSDSTTKPWFVRRGLRNGSGM